MRALTWGLLLVWVTVAAAAVTQDKKTDDKKKPEKKVTVFTDPEKAGVDFAIQGEYRGMVGKEKFGAQVVALGDGKFDVYFLPGGLPGAGWDGKTRQKVAALRDKDDVPQTAFVYPEAAFKDKNWQGAIAHVGKGGYAINGRNSKEEEFSLKRVIRKSDTLGAKPPEGAVVLFDGSDAKEWKEGKITDDELLPVAATTKRNFTDFKLHIEFRTPFMPYARGQSRGNSGVYLQGRHEIQVLDSFGLAANSGDCGALYGHKPPSVNMCFPPLSWQTYDVEYKAARTDPETKKTTPPVVTVLHNGVKIHDNIELKGGGGPGPIHLQNHGNPVVYRNIWIVEMK